MTRILMVCLGNICRSPLAHGILQSKLNMDVYAVDSAGTASYHVGEKPDPRSIAVAVQNGLDISNQRARQFTISDFDEFDIIYAIDRSNYNNIMQLAQTKAQINKVHLFLNENPEQDSKDVPDPYYGGDEGFQLVFNLIEDTCEKIAKKLQN